MVRRQAPRELLENGYTYTTGLVTAETIEDALEAAAAQAKPAARTAYMPDDGSVIAVTHGVIVTAEDGEVGEVARTSVDFEIGGE